MYTYHFVYKRERATPLWKGMTGMDTTASQKHYFTMTEASEGTGGQKL